jgi:sugar/nucleoside kinase (ribokinase family)
MAPPHASHDVVGLGNAIVDVLVRVDEAFLAEHGVTKGAMTLIDADKAVGLYGDIGSGAEVSGGSAANTMVGVAALGGRSAFVGKVRDDALGLVFTHDIRGAGVTFATPAATTGPPTARSFILVTPDAQRTMCTFLGASTDLGPEDVDEELVAGALVTYLEGYLWDSAPARAAFAKAIEVAHRHGRKVAFTLSDPFCVDRHRADFLDLVREGADILFANEAEITSLYRTASFDEALQRVRGHCAIVALTRSEKGSVVLSADELHVIDPIRLGPLVDTTGAGDLYAGGFLHGLTRGADLGRCGRLGSLAAGEVITHLGARPEAPLARLAAERLPERKP